MENNEYLFEPEKVFDIIKSDWIRFAETVKCNRFVIGISGGIDSTCVANLASMIFGRKNVYGVSMPCNHQNDMDDVDMVFETTGIRRIDINIGTAVNSILSEMNWKNGMEIKYDTETNLPPRIRMSALYAVSQSVNGIVLNTCNLSEDVVGYSTLFGDSAGSYAPIKNLTKTEVRELSNWLGIPPRLVGKTPIDGLQPLSDEDKLGFSYHDLDEYIRKGNAAKDLKSVIDAKYKANKFKTDIIRIQGPDFGFPNFIDNN